MDYWAQTRWIELRYSLRRGIRGSDYFSHARDCFSYALGYENKKSCLSYKFLRFIDVCLFKTGNEFFWYEIYDFDSDLWTTLDVTPHWRIHSGGHGVSLKGNTYWCVKTSYDYEQRDHIICFDCTRERFGPLLPLPNGYWNSYVSLSCVREEKLAVLFQHEERDPYSFQIWITTMIEAENVSWSKFLTVDEGSHADIPLSLSMRMRIVTYGSFFIDEVKKVVMLFDKDLNCHTVNIFGEAGYGRQVDLEEGTEENCSPRMCSYVPSLLQIKEPKGGQRKNQSNLEKFQYI